MAHNQLLLIIVGASGEPLYEAEFLKMPNQTSTPDVTKQYQHFLLQSSLDFVDKLMWGNQNMFLKVSEHKNIKT